MTQESQRWSFERLVAVLSLGVAGLSLAVSSVVLFSGNGNQAQFESDRQRCLDNLLDISEAMRTMKYSGVVIPEVFSSFLSAKVAAEKSCFSGRIFEIGTDFAFVWSRSVDGFASDDAWEFDTLPEGDAARSFDTSIDELLILNDNAFAAVQQMPGAGAFPWQQPEPLDPDILP